MIRILFLSLVFWLLTLAFPSINIVGFWTTIGVVFLYGIFNFIITLLSAPISLPLKIVTLNLFQIIINVGVLYLLAHIFNKFEIIDGAFWWVILFSFFYITVKAIFVKD